MVEDFDLPIQPAHEDLARAVVFQIPSIDGQHTRLDPFTPGLAPIRPENDQVAFARPGEHLIGTVVVEIDRPDCDLLALGRARRSNLHVGDDPRILRPLDHADENRGCLFVELLRPVAFEQVAVSFVEVVVCGATLNVQPTRPPVHLEVVVAEGQFEVHCARRQGIERFAEGLPEQVEVGHAHNAGQFEGELRAGEGFEHRFRRRGVVGLFRPGHRYEFAALAAHQSRLGPQ